MNAQECTRVAQEALAAHEKHRVEVIVPQQIQEISDGIAATANGGGEKFYVNRLMYVGTEAYFKGLGFYIPRTYDAVYWGSAADEARAEPDPRPRSKLTILWQRLFGDGYEL